MANLSTQNIGANYKGILNLGSTINTPLSTTLQAITDGDGNTTPLQLATNRIALGSGTISGTSLLNFPDAGITYQEGISFGTTAQIARVSGGYLGFNATTAHEFDIAGGTKMFVTGAGVSLSPNTLTGSSATSALSISQTWNTTGNPSLIFANVTNTASGASANLMDLQVGGVSLFRINKSGNLSIQGITTINSNLSLIGLLENPSADMRLIVPTSSRAVVISSDYSFNSSASALLEIKSTTKGILFPRMTTAQKNAIASPAAGLMVYDTTLNQMSYYNGTAWVNF